MTTPVTVNQLIQQSQLPSYIELFSIDCTNISALNTVYYLTSSLGADNKVIIFNGQTYYPIAILLSGLEDNSDGAFPRPTLQISNISIPYGTTTLKIGNLIFSYGDLIGCKVTYIRTFSIYLDSGMSVSPRKFYIGKKTSHTAEGISFELRNALDKDRAFLPKRQMLKRDFPGLGINKQIG